MDKITTNPSGLGSKSFKISHTHLLLSPYNPADQEHNSNLLDTYERERIARDLECYIHEAAKSTTTNVKFNGLTAGITDRQSGLRRAMSMPRERYLSGGGGMKNKSTEKKSKETIKVSRPPPERDTSGGGMKKSETERKGGGHRRAISMPRVRYTSVDGGGDGTKNKIEKKSKEITQASMPPKRNTGGGGGMKNKSEKKTKEITKASMPPERDTGGGDGGMKKKSEKKNKEITKASGPPERDTSGGGGGMMKKSETRRKAIIQGNFWLKHASTVCSTMECDVVGFGRDFLRADRKSVV